MKKLYIKSVFALLLLGGCLFGTSIAQSPFSIEMEVPPLLDTRNDTLYMQLEYHNFGLPGLESVQTMAYTYPSDPTVNSYLGPTLTWEQGDTQRTFIQNLIPDTANTGYNYSTVHWHGANIPAWTDGGPHQVFYPVASGLMPNTFTPKFKVLDNPCTLWYHPHAEDVTYTQVQMGLAGIIRVIDTGDPVDSIVPHTYKQDDFPLIIQDIHFKADTTVNPLNQDTTITYSIDTLQSGNPTLSPRTMVVNGTVQPYLKVPPQPVRFRLLNGSTRNSYMLSFVTDPSGQGRDTSKVPMALLSSDGGYLPDSVRYVDSLETSPGVRNGVIVDFSSHGGDTLYLINIYQDLRDSVVGGVGLTNGPRNPIKNVMLQIRVDTVQTTPLGVIPSSLPTIAPFPSPDTTRIIKMTKGNGSSFGIDSNQFEIDTINTVVIHGTTEHWTIENLTNVAHPFHQHLVQFFVLKVETNTDTLLGELNNPSKPLPVEYLGPKDDILVHAGEKVTYSVTFDSYSQPKPFNLDSSAYMYHCHILTHEDGYYGGTPSTVSGRSPYGMMQQFAVWNEQTSVATLEEELEPDRFVLFPNPAKDVIYLNGECNVLSTVQIYDLQGKLLLEKLIRPFEGTTSIDIPELSAGVVVFKWSSPSDQFVKKLVLE